MPILGDYEPSPMEHARRQVELYEATGGRDGATTAGKPVVVLTCRGARSGKVRKTPMMRVEHGGVYAVIASYQGRDVHPAWYRNLVAHPLAALQDGPTIHEVTARESFGAERQLWWDRAVDVWPDYADYQTMTDRVIPVVLLEPSPRRSPRGR